MGVQFSNLGSSQGGVAQLPEPYLSRPLTHATDRAQPALLGAFAGFTGGVGVGPRGGARWGLGLVDGCETLLAGGEPQASPFVDAYTHTAVGRSERQQLAHLLGAGRGGWGAVTATLQPRSQSTGAHWSWATGTRAVVRSQSAVGVFSGAASMAPGTVRRGAAVV